MPVILSLWGLKQEDQKFDPKLGNLVLSKKFSQKLKMDEDIACLKAWGSIPST